MAQKNQQHEFRGSVIPEIVTKMLREQDAVIGHLTDHHVKWLLMFSMMWFDTRRVSMAFDFHSTPKQVYVTPRTSTGGVFPIKQWLFHKVRMFAKRHEKDLPAYIDLRDFEIKFCRTPKLGIDVEEIPDAPDEGKEPATAAT